MNEQFEFPFRTVPTPGGRFPRQIIGPDGNVHIGLTLAAQVGLGRDSSGTDEKYLRHARRWEAWLQGASPGPLDPEQLRSLVARYLSEIYGCRVRWRGEGFYVNPTQHRSSTIRVLIAAIIAYVDVLMDHDLLVASSNPLRRPAGKDEVGCFAVKRTPWTPHYYHEPALRQMMVARARQDGWQEWALCLLELLFDSGARTSDAIDLRLRDWLISGCGDQLSAPSKGSGGDRVKRLVILPETEARLKAYFDGERARRTGTTLASLRAGVAANNRLADVPLFVSARTGASPRPGSFRDLWRESARRLGLPYGPHAARHWHVTVRVADILVNEPSPLRQAQKRAALIKYMHWANGEEMLHVYSASLSVDDTRAAAHVLAGDRIGRDAFYRALDCIAGDRDLLDVIGTDDD